jgi:hypothetical protein
MLRASTCATLALGLALTASAAGAQTLRSERPAVAVSAERFAVRANYVDARAGHGYSAQSRHMTDCLATYSTYDPRTDRVAVRPGVTHKCSL